jgi:hypothetical protein
MPISPIPPASVLNPAEFAAKASEGPATIQHSQDRPTIKTGGGSIIPPNNEKHKAKVLNQQLLRTSSPNVEALREQHKRYMSLNAAYQRTLTPHELERYGNESDQALKIVMRRQTTTDPETDSMAAIIQEHGKGKTLKDLVELYGSLSESITSRATIEALIKNKMSDDLIEIAINRSRIVTDNMKKCDAVTYRAAPQGFLVRLGDVPDGGRCLPLVRLMAVAESQGNGNNQLDSFFTAVANEDNHSSRKFYKGIELLHCDSRACQAVESDGEKTIMQIIETLKNADEPVFLSVNTHSHAMLVGFRPENEAEEDGNYLFYDPNFARGTFKNTEDLHNYLKKHFKTTTDEFKMTESYRTVNVANKDSVFNVEKINTEEMASLLKELSIKDTSDELAGAQLPVRSDEETRRSLQRQIDNAALNSLLLSFDSLTVDE